MGENEDKGRATPFSNVREYVAFLARNCDRCCKGYDHMAEITSCDIEEALSFASIDDGTIGAGQYRRMGGGSGQCTEFAPIRSVADPERRVDLPGQAKLF